MNQLLQSHFTEVCLNTRGREIWRSVLGVKLHMFFQRIQVPCQHPVGSSIQSIVPILGDPTAFEDTRQEHGALTYM